jgi:hypothetical protein
MINIKVTFRFELLFILFALFLANSAIAQISDAIVNKQQTQISIGFNKLHVTESYEIIIYNRDGESYTHVEIPYSKLNRVNQIEAYIKDKDGKIVKKLKLSDIKDRSAMQDFSFYEDNFVKEFTLLHNVYPYTLFYKYQEDRNEFFQIQNWCPIISRHVPTHEAILTLDVPTTYKLNFYNQLVDSFKIDTVGTNVHYKWKASYAKEFEFEIYSPSKIEFYPRVEIVPKKFRFAIDGSFENWKTYGNWEYRLMEGLDELTATEKNRTDELIKNAVSDKEKIKILYHNLQDETRYVNISIDKGGMKPYPATYVCDNKYGDCKALANYFRAVLKYIGVKSFYTDVFATNVSEDEVVKKINRKFPSQQFNHVILCVPLKNDSLWLDCTTKYPFNYMGTFTQNRDVFIVDKDNSSFARTPALSREAVCSTRNVEIQNDLSTGVTASFQKKYKGETFEYLSALTRDVNESNKDRYIRNNFIESNCELIEYKIIQAHRDSAYIMFNYTAKVDNLLKNYGGEQLFKVLPFYIPPFKEPKTRKLPVQIDFPIYKIDTLNYKIPKELTIVGMPQNQTISSQFGEYNISFQIKENNVKITKSFLLKAGDYTLTEYKAFYNFIKKVSDIEYSNYIITRK